MTNDTANNIGRAWVAASVALILLATVTPQPEWSNLRQDFFSPFVLMRIGWWRDPLQNVLLYIPLGVSLRLKGISLSRAFLAAAATALVIELLQFWVPGRNAVARDVVTNTTGSVVGWLAVSTPLGVRVRGLLLALERWLAGIRRPDRRVAATLSLGWAVLVSIIVTATCWLLSPALPPPFFYAVAAPTMDRALGSLRIGSDGTPYGVFNGLIDEVRIYSRARTTEDIQSDMGRAISSAQSSDPDLVAAYGFDSKEETFASDATGRGNHAAVRHVTWTADGKFGGALAFDGRVSEAIAPGSPDFRRGTTLEAWVFPHGTMRGDVPVIADERDGYYLRASSYNDALVPSAGTAFGGASRAVHLRRPIPQDHWTHLAMTYDGQIVRMYVNGQLSGTLIQWSSHHPSRMSLDAVDLPFGSIANPSSFPAVLSSAFKLKITLTCGELQKLPAPAFLLAGLQSVDVLALEAAGSELRVRSATWARRLGLASAYYRIPNVLSGCSPGQNLSLVLNGPLQNPSVEDLNGAVMVGVRPGMASGWTFLIDSQLMPLWVVAILSACYMAALCFPFGFWARSLPLTGVGALLLSGSFYLAPRVWELHSIDRGQIATAIVGILLGAIASRVHSDVRESGGRQ